MTEIAGGGFLTPSKEFIAGFRLSRNQAAVWGLVQRQSGMVVQLCVAIGASIAAADFEAAFRVVAADESMLRTRLTALPGMMEPLQAMGEAPCLWIGREGSRTVIGSLEIQAAAAAERAAISDAPDMPLWRCRLFERPKGETLCVLSASALVADLESLRILCRRVFQHLQGGEDGGDQPPLQFAEFVEWEKEALPEDGRSDAAETEEVVSVLPFECAVPAPVVSRRRLRLPARPDLTVPIRALALRQAAPPASVVLAAWATLAARLMRVSSLSIAVSMPGRLFDELNDCVGPFATFGSVRIDISAVSDGLGLVRRLGGVLAVMGEKTSQAALEEPLIAFEYGTALDLGAGEASLRELAREPQPAFHPLSLACDDRGGGFELSLCYDEGRFTAEEMSGLGRSLQALLAALIEAPASPPAGLAAIAPADLSGCLSVLNANCGSFGFADVVSLIGRHRSEERVAVVCGEEGVSQAALLRRVAAAARGLRGLGVGPEVPVGVLMERSVEQIVAVLAVLSAGGAYVPLDPLYPAERLCRMARESGARLVIAGSGVVFPEGLEAERLDLGALSEGEGEAELPEVPAGALAYVIFTSGSSGGPKGVGVTRSGLGASTAARRDYYGAPVSSFLLLSSLSFDSSVAGLFWTLCDGGTLVLPAPGEERDPARLLALIERHGVSHLLCLGSLYAEILADPDCAGRAGTLRVAIVAGEACAPDWVSAQHGILPLARLYNEYGPTEATVWSSVHRCAPEDGTGRRVPIGRGIATARHYVVEPGGILAPPLVPGEVWIGGAGVARGYLGRPAATADAFRPDPYAAEPGARCYRSGDLARYDATGVLDFLGRRDAQVKLRGYRIEIGEIEVELRRQEGVRAAAVTLAPAAGGRERLAACLVAEGVPAPDRIRERLAAVLPDYMLPASFHFVSRLPMLPNGKLDRAALPQLCRENENKERRQILPRTHTEQLVSSIWCEALKCDSVDIDDEFVALGGHSLLAIPVVARIRRAFKVELPMASVLGRGTVRSLAVEIDRLLTQPGSNWTAAIMPTDRTGPLPVSAVQERFWFLEQVRPGDPAHHCPFAVEIAGSIDAEALRRAFEDMVERHEILRTALLFDGEGVVQRIQPHGGITMEMRDLTAEAPDRAADFCTALLRSEAAQPFDLAKGRMIRALLVHLAEDRWVLILTAHHSVIDAQSMHSLAGEMAQRYRALRDGDPEPLPAPELHYADFASWQRRMLEDPLIERQLDFWRDRLDGAPPAIDLPRKGGHAGRSPRSARARRLIPTSSSSQLGAIVQTAGTTRFVGFLTVFKLLLCRYSGQWDLVVGSPIDLHDREELEGMVGCFLNPLPLRSQLAPDLSFVESLHLVHETALAAYANAQVPFERVVARKAPGRRPDQNPIFQVMFAYRRSRLPEITLPDAVLTACDVDLPAAPLDLTLSLEESVEGLAATLLYDAGQFDPIIAEGLLRHFETFLTALLEQPHSQVGAVPLFDADERADLLALACPPAAEGGRGRRPLHRLFEDRAAAEPGRAAVRWGGQVIGYGALDRAANRLAHHLVARGVGPGVRVGLLLDRGISLIVALLAVGKAGGTYLPLELSSPPDRLAFCLADSVTALVIVDEGSAGLLDQTDPPRLDLSAEAPLIAVRPEEALAVDPSPDELLYLLYTSGSTGRPKAVMVPQGAVWHLISEVSGAIGLRAGDEFLATTRLGFDVAAMEIFGPLTAGGTIRLLPAGVAAAEAVCEVLAEVAPEWRRFLQGTPSFLRMILQAGVPKSDLVALAAGEALEEDLAAAVLDRVSCLWNYYGPTETTIYSTGEQVVPGNAVTIGRPVGETVIHILDDRMEPVPVGVVGHLHVGGRGVSRGYHGRPDLTAVAFRPDPFSGRPGARLYHTGDLARRLPDGRFAYVGRADGQVKLRGFRIELGEIEAALRRVNGIVDAVVTARVDGGEKRLVAYFCAEDGAEPEIGAVRAALSRALPDYMVPSWFTLLQALPLNANGKVDRKALPAPIFGETEEYVSPRGALEEAMSALWGDVLGLGRVSAVGNFFSLGGHSLTATRLVMRVRTVFSVELGLRSLFEASDLRSFCRLVAAAQGTASGGGGLRPLVPDPERRHEPFPLTPVQQAYWVGRDGAFELGRVAAHGYLEFELEDFDAARLEEALNVLIARHDMLRAVMLSDGRQRILASVERYRVALTDLSEVELVEREARLLAVREELSHQVLPVDRWPLFEVRASLLPEGRGRLHVSVDILIADGWSFQLLADELRRLYRDPSALAPVVASVLSFRDYVLVQEASRDGEEYRTARRYWEGRLADLPAAPQLPLARRAELVTTPRFERREGRLDAPAWQALKREASRHGLTASSVALCVYAETLGRYSRQARLTINLTLFNRPPVHEEIDRIVGDFTSTLLLSSEVGMGAFAERARRVQERLWEALDHRQMSGVEVLRELARQDGRGGRAAMPVVFTSALDLGEGGAEEAAEGFEAVYGLSQTPQVWLDLQVFEQRGGLRANLDAVEELFPFGLLDSLFGDYLSALSALAEDPRSWEAEPSAVPLSAWPDGPSAPLPDERLEAGFLRQAALDPSRAAVIHGESRICYGELERASRRLGREVRRLGGTRGELVGVLAPKGSGQVLAVLAVLRAGAAYLPLDPDLPGERLAGLVSDAGVRLVLTAPGLAPALPDGVARLTVTPAFEPLEDDGAALDLDEGAADDLAYVIYTSGSTGKPKGVSLTHRAALNTVEDINERYGVGPGDRVLALSSLSFDLSVYDLFGVLGAGGAVVVPEQARDPAGWLGSLRREEVTMWNSVPSSLQMLVDYAEARGEALPETLRLILLSGDWIPVDLASRLRRMLPGSELVSLGGATEAAIWSIYYPIHSVDPEWTSIPYGKALRNQRMMVLNEALEPCPMWVTGEIHIGGSGLALGYWRDPERSAERFIRHPRHGIWLYRTGDLGRLLPDGNIQFLGREDAQVKINGYRIELGEVEVALARWPGAREAAVVVRDGPGGKRMIGYVASPEPVEPAELRAFLATILPAYMIPARLIGTPDLPRTANGKLDRKALVTQDDACEPKPGNVAEPSALDRIRTLIESVTGLTGLKTEENLVERGMSSLDVIRLVNQLRQSAGIELPIEEIYRRPTIGRIAELADIAAPSETPAKASPMLTDPDEILRFKSTKPGLRPLSPNDIALRLDRGETGLASVLRKRSSRRSFAATPVSFRQFGALLNVLAADDGERRGYGSAGGLYPVQSYLLVRPRRVERLGPGLYYYDPVRHQLIYLSGADGIDDELDIPLLNREVVNGAAFLLVQIVHMPAIEPLYGEAALSLSLLEAGSMAQSLELAATELGLGLCQMGGIGLERAGGRFRLQPGDRFLHSLAGGIPASGEKVDGV